MEDEAHWLVSDGKVKAHGLRGTSLDKTMTFGEAGSAFAFAILAFLSVIVAAKAYTPEYAFHAYLFTAAGAPLRRLFWASAAPWRHSARHGALLGAALLGALAAGAFA